MTCCGGGFLGESAEQLHFAPKPRWQLRGHVSTVLEVNVGLAAFKPTRAGKCLRRACRKPDPQGGLSAERGFVGGVRGGAGANYEGFAGVRSVE